MISVNCYKKKTIGVFGLARTGLAAVASLISGGAWVIAWDDNDSTISVARDLLSKKKELSIALSEGRLRLGAPSIEDFKRMNSIVISPGIPMKCPSPNRYVLLAEQHGVNLISDIELLQIAQPAASYVGVTGTNGKSTTTALINHILRVAGVNTEMGGNIGEAALSLAPLELDEVYVLEVSSFQLDLFSNVRFDIAIALSIKQDHIDRYGSFENYFESKRKIFNHQSTLDYAIVSVNSGNEMFNVLSRERDQNIIPISSNKLLDDGVSFIKNKIIDNYFLKVEYDFEAPESLLGEHNAENIAAAFASASAAGVAPDVMIQAIKSFKALPHRMEVFYNADGLRFINDSKATNADAAYWALKTFDEIYWILGGLCKDDGIEQLSEFFPKIKHAFLIGNAADDFAETLSKYGVDYTISVDLESACREVKSMNLKKGNIILSPACASQDQWRNYEERGAKFKELILAEYSNMSAL